jgi:hypothetical protein
MFHSEINKINGVAVITLECCTMIQAVTAFVLAQGELVIIREGGLKGVIKLLIDVAIIREEHVLINQV